jgi:uncharacterized protein (TIGR00269 family)
LTKSVERRFHKSASKLVAPGERVVAAVSGGKDSVVCMYLLAEHCSRKRCELIALTIDEGIGGYREESLLAAERNAKSLNIEHHIVSFKKAFGATLDEIVRLAREKETGFGPCTYCGVLRRSLMNRTARELEADKLVTAHNLDDEVQAIMLNHIRADLARLHRLGPIYPALKGFVPRVKPLRETPEKEVALYAMFKGIEVDWGECPYRAGIHLEIRDFINRLEENHPNSKFMILRMFDRMKPHLAQAVPEFEARVCERCGEPTSVNVCKKCELLGQLELVHA